ncbi:MAG: lipoyl(octanoyl) transferase LipB [Nitrospira sp.]|nr:lipoyl(octanoyl) transferase LipB [Nitrospira sp.]
MMATPLDYADAWLLQQRLHAERVAERRFDTLLLLEHRAVYTLGRRTLPAHLPQGEAALLATGAQVVLTNRGGSVTYHGPGQLVGYPIVRLSRSASGPKQYVWLLEECLRCTLAHWGIEARRLTNSPGLFVDMEGRTVKLASIGVRVEHGVTLHGFALNVDLDMTPFSHIIPCGLDQYRPTSVAAVCGSSVSVRLAAQQVAKRFAEIFKLTWDVGVSSSTVESEKEHTHHA